MSPLETHKPLKFRDRNAIISRILIIISVTIFLVAVVMVTVAVRRSLQRQAEMTKLIGLAEAQGGDIKVARQIYDAIQKVGKLTKLPDNEIPIYATIADIAKLQAQPVFKDAVNGDQILLYSKSQWIYIYRPQIDKIVAQGPFALPSPTPEQQPQQPQMQQQMQQQPPPQQPEEPVSLPTEPPPVPVVSDAPASPEAGIPNP